MKRIGVFLIVLALLVLAADFFLRMAAEDAAARLIDKRMALRQEPDVDLGGFPFLPSLVRGNFDRVTIEVASAKEGRAVIENIHLRLENVEVEALEVLGGDGTLRVESLRGRGVMSETTLNELLAANGSGVSIDVEEGGVLLSRGELSVPADAVLAGNNLRFAGGDVLGPLEVRLPALLPDVRFTSLRAERDRIVLGVAASRLRIRA